MISFESDYNNGALPEILAAYMETFLADGTPTSSLWSLLTTFTNLSAKRWRSRCGSERARRKSSAVS